MKAFLHTHFCLWLLPLRFQKKQQHCKESIAFWTWTLKPIINLGHLFFFEPPNIPQVVFLTPPTCVVFINPQLVFVDTPPVFFKSPTLFLLTPPPPKGLERSKRWLNWHKILMIYHGRKVSTHPPTKKHKRNKICSLGLSIVKRTTLPEN